MSLYGDLGEYVSAPQRTDDTVLFDENGKRRRIDLVLRSGRTGQEKWRIPLSEIRAVAGSDSTGNETPPAAPLSGTTLLLPRLEGERSRPTAVDVRTGKQK